MKLKWVQIEGPRPVGWNGRIRIMLLLFLLLSTFPTVPSHAQTATVAAALTANQTERLQPDVEAWMAQNPGLPVRVIVQANGEIAPLAAHINALGGRVILELPLIHAVAVEVPATELMALSARPDVRSVSLDAPVISSAVPAAPDLVLRDEFSAKAFTGNNGTTNWSSNWTESGESNGATSGYLQVVSNSYCASGNCLRMGADGAPMNNLSMSRKANLYGMASATLSFSYRRQKLDVKPGAVAIEVSADNGVTWTALATYSLPATDSGQVAQSFNISAYMSANTQIRFKGSGTDPESYFFVDNVEIRAIPSTANTYLDTLRVPNTWNLGLTGNSIGVAVIDSGTNTTNDITYLTRQKFCSDGCPNSGDNDFYGHGTHVSSIIAGNGSQSQGFYKGIAPNAKIFGLKIANDQGLAFTSDAVNALQWVYNNRVANNIRVVNLSILQTNPTSYHENPLNAAVEILWFNGIVVVVSAGNTIPGNTNNPVQASPANDPFVISVGATYEGGTADRANDILAPFSAAGTTLDGHAKPDIVAPGTDIFSVLSQNSSWGTAYPNRAVMAKRYFRLSGTSMSAPMVTGAVALLLQDEPNLTPDQVKYRLINTAPTLAGSNQRYLDIYAAVTGTTTQSANTGLVASQLLWSGSEPINWNSVNWTSVNWNSVNWNSVNWNSVNWNSVNWKSVNWNSATVTEIDQYLGKGIPPADMVWETPVWSSPEAPRQEHRLLIPTIGK